MVKCPVPWKVVVYNSEFDKPGLAGHMAEYNASSSQYVTTPYIHVPSNPLKLQSERNNILSPPDGPLELTGYPGNDLQEGLEFNSEGFK